MRVILDTNVFISGVFFSGPPYKILDAWRGGKLKLVISARILEEYGRIGRSLANDFPRVDFEPFLSLALKESELIADTELEEQICSDPDDDKFIACAISSGCEVIVTGDKQLKKVSGYKNIEIISPRLFVNKYI